MSDCKHRKMKGNICARCGIYVDDVVSDLQWQVEELESSLTEMHDMCTLLVNGESVKDMDEVMNRAERLLLRTE